MSSIGESTSVIIIGLVACLLVMALIVACCYRYYKLKNLRATAAMLPDWDGHQTLNGTTPAGPAYMPAPSAANFQPLPNVLYTGSPYHHPLPSHVQIYQQQHLQTANRLPNATDRQDHLGATPGAYELNQQAAMATPNVVGCFYGAACVPSNPYGPTTYGLVERQQSQQQNMEASIIHSTAADFMTNTITSNVPMPPTYDQAMQTKPAMTDVSD